jgi:hypothetical protein
MVNRSVMKPLLMLLQALRESTSDTNLLCTPLPVTKSRGLPQSVRMQPKRNLLVAAVVPNAAQLASKWLDAVCNMLYKSKHGHIQCTLITSTDTLSRY